MRKKNGPIVGSAADPRLGSPVRTLRGEVGTPPQTLGIFRDKWLYNGGMPDALFEEMKSYVGFTADDAAAVAGLADKIRPHIPEIVERFYDVLLQHPGARLIFSGGDAQIERQEELLAGWLHEVFNGTYESRYFEARFRIGATHVRVGLPQRFMMVGMEIIWQELTGVLRKSAVTDLDRKLDALHKLLTLDLTIMLQSYQESHVERIRTAERDALEAKLIRAEHLAEIGQLAASLAHEIKNPLAGISGAIQVIGDSMGENNPHRGIVHEILGQIARLDATVKDLLLYARPSRPKAREVKLDSLVARVLMLIREEPTVRRVHVDYEASNGEAVLYADEGQMEQLLLNLILNAAHASDEGSTITVETRPHGQFTRLMVSDSGHGMKPEVLSKAVEPFFTTKAKGTGLGLAICRRIVESHGGTINLESEVGKGTTVCIDLPRGPQKRTAKR